jgi:hypothetical protein
MLMPRKAYGVSGQLSGMGLQTSKMTGNQRMSLDALLRGHEMDELAIGAKKIDVPYATAATHASPDVYLREHNRLVTSPPEVQDTLRSIMTPVRSLENHFMQSVSPQLQYGVGPRFSRHARKHLSESIRNKTVGV